MATKKKITKQLRKLTKDALREIETLVNKKYGTNGNPVITNPYRRLKRAYNRGETNLDLK